MVLAVIRGWRRVVKRKKWKIIRGLQKNYVFCKDWSNELGRSLSGRSWVILGLIHTTSVVVKVLEKDWLVDIL